MLHIYIYSGIEILDRRVVHKYLISLQVKLILANVSNANQISYCTDTLMGCTYSTYDFFCIQYMLVVHMV